jgi:hypothetical protein
MPPDRLGLDGFEERLDGGVILAISFTTHQHFEVMLAQDPLVIVRVVLAATIGVMDAAFGWCLEGYCHLQCTDRKVTFHPIANGPANDAARMQIQNHSQIHPPLRASKYS